MTSGRAKLADVEAEVIRTTNHDNGSIKAYLLEVGDKQGWVPASAVEDNDDGTFTMPYDMAYEKGFI